MFGGRFVDGWILIPVTPALQWQELGGAPAVLGRTGSRSQVQALLCVFTICVQHALWLLGVPLLFPRYTSFGLMTRSGGVTGT